jgi:4-hydroxy-tetrahydrodipicolinate synthase
MPQDFSTALEGILGIPVTPFDEHGIIDYEELADVVRRIATSGINVVVACGNTSENASLTPEEAERVAAVTIEASAGEVIVLVGVGGALEKAIDQAQTGIDRGASGVMVHFPSDPYISDAGLVRYYEALAGSVDGLVVLYVRGRGLSTTVLDSVVELENVVAVKYAIPDVLAFGEFAAGYGDAVVPICGLAELWAPFFWLVGARGFTSGLVNLAPKLSIEMLEALRGDDLSGAMDVWRLIAPFERLRARDANSLNVSVVKGAMALVGLIEHGTVRPPISVLQPTERAELETVLATWAAHV